MSNKKISLYLKRGAIWSWCISFFIAYFLTLNNPRFLDSFKHTFLYFIVGSVFLGLGFSLCWYVVRKIFSRPLDTIFFDRDIFSAILIIAGSLIIVCANGINRALLAIGIALVWTIFCRKYTMDLIRSLFNRIIKIPTILRICIVLGVVFLFVFGIVLRREQLSPVDDNTFLLLGFDGATWDIAGDMLKKKLMPNLERFKNEGTIGNLRSLTVMFSPQIWNTIATGKYPKDHGIMDFYASSQDLKAKPLWDIMAERGNKVGVFGYFTTSPPYEVPGFMIPGHDAAGTETYPMKFEFFRQLYTGFFTLRNKKYDEDNELLIKNPSIVNVLRPSVMGIRYGWRLSTIDYCLKIFLATKLRKTSLYHDLDMNYRFRFAKLRLSSDMFSFLLRIYKPTFAVYYNKLPDNICHEYWKYFAESKSTLDTEKFSNVISKGYEEWDLALGKIVDTAGRKATIFVVSDHGFKTVEDSSLIVRGETLVNKLGLQESVRAWNIGEECQLRILHGNIEQVMSLLKEARIIETGKKLFKVWKDNSLSENELLIRVNNQINEADFEHRNVNIGNKQIPIRDFCQIVSSIEGHHAINGLLAVRGPNVKSSFEIQSASVLDITPAMLYLMGYSIARDMPGYILQVMVKEDYLRTHPTKYVETYGPSLASQRNLDSINESKKDRISEALKEKLRSLGYIK